MLEYNGVTLTKDWYCPIIFWWPMIWCAETTHEVHTHRLTYPGVF